MASRVGPEPARTPVRRVGFFAPSGYLPDAGVMDRAAAFFAARGWEVSAGDSVFSRDLRFAGPDDLRARELQQFATDRRLDAAVSARGGYGIGRLLEHLDYDAIAAARVPLVGYSDFTAFNLALLARAGGISFQGPSASDFSGADDTSFTVGQFFDALTSPVHAVEFATATRTPALDLRGRLWGGNLSMVCSLLGTPYFPRVQGGILFLEDVNEAAYRVERMLLQLLQAGVLGRQRAVLLGDFSPMPVLASDNGFDLGTACDWLRARCDVPLITGLPFGHGRRRVTLAVGAAARLRVDAGAVRLEYRGHPTLEPR